MKPRITVITIGVDDLDASLRLYRDGLGMDGKYCSRPARVRNKSSCLSFTNRGCTRDTAFDQV
jgi:hypothetical protein